MIRLKNQEVQIAFGDRIIPGVLNGTLEGWSFQSDDHDFKELFPAGVLYSFSNYGPGMLYSQMVFQDSVRERVKEIIRAYCYDQRNATTE